MARCCVHRLRLARRRPVSIAVLGRAEMRPPFDDLSRDPDPRRGRVEAGFGWSSRAARRCTTRRGRTHAGSGGVPVVGPFPDVACHVVEPESVRGIGADGSGSGPSIDLGVVIGKPSLPGVRDRRRLLRVVITPREDGPVQTASRRILPLGFGRERQTAPATEGLCIAVADLYDRVILQPIDRAAGAKGLSPVRIRCPRPPIAVVPEVDRVRGQGEHEGAGHQILWCRSRKERGIRSALGLRHVSSGFYERRELRVGHGEA